MWIPYAKLSDINKIPHAEEKEKSMRYFTVYQTDLPKITSKHIYFYHPLIGCVIYVLSLKSKIMLYYRRIRRFMPSNPQHPIVFNATVQVLNFNIGRIFLFPMGRIFEMCSRSGEIKSKVARIEKDFSYLYRISLELRLSNNNKCFR